MLLSFVIPCYHSEHTLPNVAKEIQRVITDDGRYDYEIILVNDNALDDTYRTIRQLCREDGHIRGICMSKNFGQHAALMAGYGIVRGDIVISMDDDGQTPAAEVFKLVDSLGENVDIAYSKYKENHYSLFRRLGSEFNDLMLRWLLDKPKGLYLSSYFAAKRTVIDEIVKYRNPYPYIDGLILRTTRNIVNVTVSHLDRQCGNSGYTLSKLLNLWLNGFTAFSIKPLRVATLSGLVFSTIGFLLAVVLAVRKICLGSYIDAGWSSLMCMLLIVGGFIMMMAGMLGEYIGRIYISINNAPQYVIRETCGGDEDHDL